MYIMGVYRIQAKYQQYQWGKEKEELWEIDLYLNGVFGQSVR